jgi:hypothetical protein
MRSVAKHEGINFRPGDILLVRTGLTNWYDNEKDIEFRTAKSTVSRCLLLFVEGIISAHQLGPRKIYCSTPKKNIYFIGLKADDESRDWLYSKHFAAVSNLSSPAYLPFTLTIEDSYPGRCRHDCLRSDAFEYGVHTS